MTYEEFGAVGDGVTNDFVAICKAHAYANENRLPVKATAGKTYYISDTHIDEEIKTVIIKTDVTWTGADFIIDDSKYSTHNDHDLLKAQLFSVESYYPITVIESEEVLAKVMADGLNRQTKKIDLGLGYPALIIPYNKKHPIYRRKGYGAWAGTAMHDVILLDKDGNVADETPVMWNYNHVDYIEVIRADIEHLTIEGGKFTTIASDIDCVYYDENGKPLGVRDFYAMRGLYVGRSYTTVKNVEHYVEGEISIERQKKGEIGIPQNGFYTAGKATNVTFESCVMTGKRCYQKAWVAEGFSGTRGTYDIKANNVNKIIFKNCTQSNFWVTIDDNNVIHPAKEEDEGALLSLSKMVREDGKVTRVHWGVGGTNYCKNMEYIGCTLSRFDAHDGLYNGKVIDSTVVAIALTGCGDMLIENTRVFAESHGKSCNRLFSMRNDYGSTWEGNITVKGLKAYVYSKRSDLKNTVPEEYSGIYVVSHNYHNWYYGYDCNFPNITLDSIELYDIETHKPIPDGTEVRFVTGNLTAEPNMHLDTTVNVHPIFPDVDEDGDGLIDGTNIPRVGAVRRGGVLDESSNINLNPIVPPKYFKVVNNKKNYVYLVEDTSTLDGVVGGGFFEKTEFISGSAKLVGAAHSDEKTETFKFIKC